MKNYYFKDKTFVVENYNRQKPFANFLPGVAGKKGIPLWAFYVNRAQGIAGYGLQDKSRPIMAFTPANKAYEVVSTTGFRTFIKSGGQYYEAFAVDSDFPHRMEITQTHVAIEEENQDLGLKIRVTYFGLPNMPLAALVRKVEVTNESGSKSPLEILDGITEILPAGIHNEGFKSTSNLLASWMDVDKLDDDFAFYKLRASTGDSSEVKTVTDGNFYAGFTEEGLIRPIVDQDLVFGYNTAKTKPVHFIDNALDAIKNASQVTVNKIPCGFIPLEKTLAAGETLTLYGLSGHTQNVAHLKKRLESMTDFRFMRKKETEATAIIDDLLNDVDTDTAFSPFNEYIRQNYLDNFLRGGYPVKIGRSIYHLYSRRHGDLERDYNFFSLAPEYYSQGNGNFRDVCQNRRMDSVIHRDVEAFNIRHFASLIQLDGYNPLAINGIRFTLDAADRKTLIARHFRDDGTVEALLSGQFTPGQLVNTVENNDIPVTTDEADYLEEIFTRATPHIDAQFGEGYWSDHFTYILDLVENYEAIYPDRMEALLLDDETYAYFDSPVSVLKQSEKSTITKEGLIRQYGSLLHYDKEKIRTLGLDPHASNWTKSDGKRYYSNLYTKLLSIIMNKHSQLDPEGFGIEMEAEKPGWNDAMNGIPGLFGSGISEAIETLRMVTFLKKYTPSSGTLDLPEEMHTFFKGLSALPDYERRVALRENYRDEIRLGLSGKKKNLAYVEAGSYLETLGKVLKENLEKLLEISEAIPPTFLTYSVEDYEEIKDGDQPVIGNYKLPLVRPKKFKRHALPKFLEAPARLLKTDFDRDRLMRMHEKIRTTGIYDDALKMYKTSECLDGESHEIGRIRAFTKGWLERESNFLHMTYKYLLGLLKAGFHDAFYEEIKTNLVCFMDPAVYGRNTLENSSFIAPSNNPNPAIHGQGFFARLSGSTVEVINMWSVMMTGGRPFRMKDGELTLSFDPKLHGSFFKEDGTLSFNFLKDIRVTYINKDRKSTYGKNVAIRQIELDNGVESRTIKGGEIRGEDALSVREGSLKAIRLYID